MFSALPKRRFNMNLEAEIKKLEAAVAELKLAAGQRDEPEGYNWELAAKLGVLVNVSRGQDVVLSILDAYYGTANYAFYCADEDWCNAEPSTLAGHIRVHDGSKECPVSQNAVVFHSAEWCIHVAGQKTAWENVVAFIGLPKVEV